MASLFMFSCIFIILSFSFNQFFFVTSTEFEVGGDHGWVVPKPKTDQMYNQWASKNRFNVDDTVHFKYKKDSVLVVSEEEYEKCHSAHPLFFSNNDDSVFKLDRPGLFYFISGVAGHCERGQKMIIKVLEPANPPQSANSNTTTTDSSNNIMAPISSPVIVSSFMVSFFGVLFL
ncbi:early nodulin-like protein 5 [Alnus glutinosa]|uniref:early nodulin-like protein 5 n=1 Tax=Alnus glutinosa TaxID=3517 RepID=UPI002D776CA2|nr:early nodulin-like protein 5 [Alnus glutinosa]